MDYITDMHTHILYGVDDGARSLKDSIRLIMVERRQGVKRIFLTPHYGPKFGYPDRELLETTFREIQQETKKYYPNIRLYLGSELYYQRNTIQDLKEGRALTMAGSKYILVEFGTGDSYSSIFKAVQDMIYAGYLPIIAHVERYEAVLNQMERARELVKAGAYLQINAESFTGTIFNRRTAFCMKLLKAGLVCFVASDCHDLSRRCPNMREGMEAIHKKMAGYSFEQNIDKVIEGKYI